MRQAIMTSPGKIEFKHVDNPAAPGPGEILLKVRRIGICGSDIHVYHGKHPFTSYPIVQGHEYSGEVVSAGSQVNLVKPGDKVSGRPQLVCGECNPCRRNQYNVCEKLKVQGFQANGCAQDFFVIPEERAVKIPDSMGFNEGAFIEPLAVGAHSTRVPSSIKGKNVVVFGGGTIGNIVAQFVRAKGAAKVMVSDPIDFKLVKAKECGIEYVHNPMNEDFKDCIKRVFGNEGFQLAFEAAGAESPILDAVHHIENGSEIIILGVFDKPARIHMSYVCERELKILGSMMYTHEDYLEAVDYLSKGLINIGPLISKEFPFEDYEAAYRYIDEKGDECLKVLINMDAHE